MKTPLSLAFLFLAACASGERQDALPPGSDLARAADLIEAGELDDALLITDALLRQDSANREALLIAARGNIALFESGRSGGQAFLQDAIACLETATSLKREDSATWQQLAGLYLKNSQFEKGRDSALKAAELLKASNASATAQADAVLAAADNELQIFVDARRAEGQEDPEPATRELASTVLDRLRWAGQARPATASRKAALVYQWLGDEERALAEMERGILAEPDNGELHVAYQNTYDRMDRRAECVAAYKRLLRDRSDTPILHWYLGRAQIAHADGLRHAGRWDPARQAYAAATDTYAHYAALQPQHKDATAHWLAISWLSRGRVAIELGDLENARASYEQALEATPRVAQYEESGRPALTDDFGHYYIAGLDLIGRAITDASTPRALADGLAHYERILDRHPDQFGFIYNNAALCARDLGVAVERAASEAADPEAELKRANELYETSYQHYVKAVEHAPDDPRIVNDCGLMLLYHLHRDDDRAREMFDRAIELGEAQIAELPEDADEDQKRFLEEAVGDAYQNVAVLMRKQERPFDDYKSFLVEAVKFYPYQQREAAALLRDGGKTKGPTPAQQRNQGRSQDPSQDPSQNPAAGGASDGIFQTLRREAAAKAEAEDYDGALLVLDAAAKKFADHPGFLALVGTYSLRYANRARIGGGNALQIDGLYSDAVKNLTQAVELDGEPVAPRLELTQALYDSGDFAKAAETADSLLSHVRSAGGADAEELRRTHALRALASTRVYIAAKQAGNDDAEALRTARTSFRELEKSAENGTPLDNSTLTTWSTLEQWAGAKGAALDVVARAIARRATGGPIEDTALLGQLTDLGASTGSSDVALTALREQTGATATWFAGKAWFNRAQELVVDDQLDAALDALKQAEQAFEAAKRANPDFERSSTQWQALCRGKRGTLLLNTDREGALQSLLEAARISPDQLTQSLGAGYTIKHGLLVVADKYYRDENLGKVVDVYRQAAEVAPTDSDFANNLGLMARDHGVALERDGKKDEANKMYEMSYAAYTKAAELEPERIRLINDRALLLIYHLQRELDLAQKLLRQGIAKGEQRLAEEPPTDEKALAELQESIGDCYQNLGVYYAAHTDDDAAAIRNFEKSLTFTPFEERASRKHLETMKNKAAKDGDGK